MFDKKENRLIATPKKDLVIFLQWLKKINWALQQAEEKPQKTGVETASIERLVGHKGLEKDNRGHYPAWF